METNIISSWTQASTEKKFIEMDYKEDWRKFIDFAWPASISCLSPVPSVFLSAVQKPHLLNRSKAWIVRDGLAALTWFFLKNPYPHSSLKTKLYVQPESAELIPSAWAKHFGIAQLFSEPKKPEAIKRVLFVGIASPRFVGISELKKILLSTHKKLEQNKIKISEYSIFSPPRIKDFGQEHEHDFQFQYAAEIIKVFGTNYKSLDWHHFYHDQTYSDAIVVDLNSNILISDNYCVHHALSVGASLLPQPISSKDKKIKISPNYGWILSDSLPHKKNIQLENNLKETQDFIKFLDEDKNLKVFNLLPWPQWVSEWAESQKKKGQ